MSRRNILGWLLVLAVVAWCAPAHAANALAGSWRASSGRVVQIPEGSGDFDLVFVESQTGTRKAFKAYWIQVGRQLEWIDAQGSRHTATVDPKNPDRIKDVNPAYPTSPAYWYRIR